MLKFATWNINGVRRRLPLLLNWLGDSRPDVVAPRETKVVDSVFPAAALANADYASVAVGQKTWNGVGLWGADGCANRDLSFSVS